MGGEDKASSTSVDNPRPSRVGIKLNLGKKDHQKQGKKNYNALPINISRSINAFRMEFDKTRAAPVQEPKPPEEEDEWTWESYTPESSEEDLKKRKGKKGKSKKEPKKPKKEKKEDVVVVQEEEEEEDDFMVGLLGMRPTAGEEEEEGKGLGEEEPSKEAKKGKKEKLLAPPKPKPPKIAGKKMTPKELQEYLKQLEAEAELAAEEERLRIIEEKKMAVEKEKRATIEQLLRSDQLTATMALIEKVEKMRLERALVTRAQHQWETYVKEDGMPNVYFCGDLTTYLHHWENVINKISIDDLMERTTDAMFLMESIQRLIENPVGARDLDVENWKWVNGMFRDYLAKSLEVATYRQLSNIASNMTRVDLRTAKYFKAIEQFGIFLWLRVPMPPSLPNPKTDGNLPKIDLPIPQLKIRITLPQSLHCLGQAIRVLYLAYDHISELCSTYAEPPVPEPFAPPLVHVVQQEWYTKLYYKWLHREIPEGEKPDKKLVVDKENGIIPIVPWCQLEPTASEHAIAEEEQVYLNVKESLMPNVDENEINLRQYLITGGVYCINVYYQPTQPQPRVVLDVFLRRVQPPREIWKAPFHATYEPPPPIKPAKFKNEKEYLAEVDKLNAASKAPLIAISVAFPAKVLWLDDPIVCFWDLAKSAWTTEDIYEVTYDEQVQGYSFFTGRFGCFSFAVNRFASFPFESWEMKPEKGGLNFKLVTRILTFVFLFKDDKIIITDIIDAPGRQLHSYIGVPMSLPQLIRTLRKHGVDIFPSFDAFCYVKNSCEKHWPMERHTYNIMGQMGGCFHLCWSQWNKPAGRRGIVFRMKEFKSDRRVPFFMTMVTPLNAMFIDCTENADDFCDEPVEDMKWLFLLKMQVINFSNMETARNTSDVDSISLKKRKITYQQVPRLLGYAILIIHNFVWVKFYADLHQLIRGSYNMATKTKYFNTNPQLSRNVARFLMATRIFSFA